jgi:hypothetical protein
MMRRRFASTKTAQIAEFTRKMIENQIADNFDILQEVEKNKKLLSSTMQSEGYDEDVEEILIEQIEVYVDKLKDFFYYAEKLEQNLAQIKRLN